jgi:hypothetical protein
MVEHLNYDEMKQTVAEWLESDGRVPEDDTEATALLEALGIPKLLESLHVSERIICAADGFHPVARFFVGGSAEQQYILDVLRSAPHSGEAVTG